MRKPKVFIGSSSEGVQVAHHFQVVLDRAEPCEVTVWDQQIFGAGEYTMASLVDAAQATDFAVLVMTPDDTTESRGQVGASPRDNVLFELGLFMGALGVQRVFMLSPQSDPPVKIPSDLSGITRLPPYAPRSDGNLEAALMPAVLAAKRAIRRLGTRSDGVLGVGTASVGDTAHHERALAAEIEGICAAAQAQGWRRIRANSKTTLRLVSPRGRRFTYSIPEETLTARIELRGFASELRAGGLRVNERVRRPVKHVL